MNNIIDFNKYKQERDNVKAMVDIFESMRVEQDACLDHLFEPQKSEVVSVTVVKRGDDV